MDLKAKLVELLQHDNCPLFMVFGDTVDVLADYLIAHGVTVQECTPKCWDVCYNNGNIQYRCPHCETVFVYMYKNHIAPDVCKECGARLYLPQPPKGE